MLQQKQLAFLCMFFALLCLRLNSSQTPRLPMLAPTISQKKFKNYQDMIAYQQELNAHYDYATSIKKQNINLLKNIQNMCKKIQKKDPNLWLHIALIIDESSAFMSKTTADFFHDNNTKRHSLIELEHIAAELQKHLLKLREIEVLMLYAIPTPRSKK